LTEKNSALTPLPHIILYPDPEALRPDILYIVWMVRPKNKRTNSRTPGREEGGFYLSCTKICQNRPFFALWRCIEGQKEKKHRKKGKMSL
jgi:hypothetical protein